MANGIWAAALLGIVLLGSPVRAGSDTPPPGSAEWMKGIIAGSDASTPKPPQPGPAEWMKAITYPDAGNWEWLLNSSDFASAWLVSRRNAFRHGGIASIWVRIENRDSQQDLYSGKYYTSAAEREELNCDNPATRVVSISLYSGRNLSGDTVSSRAFPAEQVIWNPAVPGTIGDALVTWVYANVRQPSAKSSKQ